MNDKPDPPDDALERWIAEGESLMWQVESGKFGAIVACIFRLGQWWADRPWRDKGKR
jgi:hypothetical protein